MKYLEQLNPDGYYHIYNRSNGNVNLFREEKNFVFFFYRQVQEIYIAFSRYLCLVYDAHHFHFLVKIKSPETVFTAMKKSIKDVGALVNKNLQKQNLQNLGDLPHLVTNKQFGQNLQDLGQTEKDILINRFVIRQFTSLFVSYTKSYHEYYNTHGNLFNQNFKRKKLKDEDSIMRVILYIHNNPVHHGFTNKVSDWDYSSYKCYLNSDTSILYSNALQEVFGNLDNFLYMHSREGFIEAELKIEED